MRQRWMTIGVAAVADYRPAETSAQKIKKGEGQPPSITLIRNPDILAEVAALDNAPLCVGSTSRKPQPRGLRAEEAPPSGFR